MCMRLVNIAHNRLNGIKMPGTTNDIIKKIPEQTNAHLRNNPKTTHPIIVKKIKMVAKTSPNLRSLNLG